MKKHTLHLTINGEEYELQVAPNELLVNVIRETVGMTGTKYACGTGQCGACTVVVNGEPMAARLPPSKA
jgi:carbon-monoxide dehydrogenase small subunit